MKKIIKVTASFLGVIILLAIFAVVLLVTLVNPNHFKPMIASQVQKYIGRQLVIDGDLSWSFYPYLGIKVGHCELSNPPQFQQKIFAELDSMTVGVKLLPLLHAKIESSGLALNKLKLNLIRNADGTTNWQDLQSKSQSKASTAQSELSSPAAKSAVAVAITGIDVNDATIKWQDDQTKQRMTIDHFDLQAKDITLLKSFPVSATLHFIQQDSALSGTVKLSLFAFFNLEKKYYRFKDIDFSAKIKKAEQEIKLNTKGALVIDMMNQQADLSDWIGEIAGIKTKGSIKVTNLTTQPVAKGYLKTEPFALQDVLMSIGPASSDVPKATNMKADLTFTFDTASKSATAFQKLVLQGTVTADELQLQKIKSTHFLAHIQLANGVLTLPSTSAVLYQGNLQSDAKIDLNAALSTIALNAKLINIQTEPLLTDLLGNAQLKFAGAGNVDLQVTTIGGDKNTIVSNLNGIGKINVSNGLLKGMDIAYLANSAYSLTKGKAPSLSDSNQTSFGDLTATVVIRSGIVNNNDLLLNMPNYIANGKGTIDLVKQQIDYSLATKAKQDLESNKNDLVNLFGLTIPIKITGSFDHPKIALDTADLTKQIAQQQLERNKEKITEQVNKVIPQVGGKLLQNILGH
jgi:AsmA protein